MKGEEKKDKKQAKKNRRRNKNSQYIRRDAHLPNNSEMQTKITLRSFYIHPGHCEFPWVDVYW